MIRTLPPLVRQWAWGPIAIGGALAPLIVSQVLQLATIVTLPLSRRVFRKLNTAIAAGVWGFWAWGLQRVNGTRVVVEGDDLPRCENAIVIVNHQSMSDIVIIMCLALRKGRLGDMKWLVKDVIKYVPGVGWGMLFLDCVFLKRNWTRDADTIRRVFSRIADDRLPVWLVSFPEGTRATPAKLVAGKAKDRARGAAAFEHLLRPKHKGFAASILGLGSHVKAVYSVTIAYPDHVPSLISLFRGDLAAVRLEVRRTPIAELVDKDEGELAEWIVSDFQRKDRWIAQFYR